MHAILLDLSPPAATTPSPRTTTGGAGAFEDLLSGRGPAERPGAAAATAKPGAADRTTDRAAHGTASRSDAPERPHSAKPGTGGKRSKDDRNDEAGTGEPNPAAAAGETPTITVAAPQPDPMPAVSSPVPPPAATGAIQGATRGAAASAPPAPPPPGAPTAPPSAAGLAATTAAASNPAATKLADGSPTGDKAAGAGPMTAESAAAAAVPTRRLGAARQPADVAAGQPTAPSPTDDNESKPAAPAPQPAAARKQPQSAGAPTQAGLTPEATTLPADGRSGDVTKTSAAGPGPGGATPSPVPAGQPDGDPTAAANPQASDPQASNRQASNAQASAGATPAATRSAAVAQAAAPGSAAAATADDLASSAPTDSDGDPLSTGDSITGLSAAAPQSQASPAVAPPGHRPMAPPPALATQIAVQIHRGIQLGADRIEIRLVPAELGRIDVRLDLGKDGRVHAAVAVDRPDTLQLLQQDARGLERALQDAGLKADSGGLTFNLRGNGGQPQNQGFAAAHHGRIPTHPANAESGALPAEAGIPWRRTDRAIDIRV